MDAVNLQSDLSLSGLVRLGEQCSDLTDKACAKNRRSIAAKQRRTPEESNECVCVMSVYETTWHMYMEKMRAGNPGGLI